MKKIAVIGNSLTAVKTIEELKAQGEDIEAIFISPENTFPYYRHQLYHLSAKKTSQSKIFYRSNTEYEKDKISFIFNKKVTRINLKRQRLTLDDKEHVDYDILFLADLPQLPFWGIKGANKAGLYNIKRLVDVNLLVKSFPVLETIVVQSDHLAGLKTALALANLEVNPPKEVLLVTTKRNILGGLLGEDDAFCLNGLISQSGIRIIHESQIVEILGDHEAKAVRLQGRDHKVYGCQAVLTDHDLPDLRLLKESELKHDLRVSTCSNGQTNFENVFALDAVCDTITFADWDVSLTYLIYVQERSKIIAAGIRKSEYVSQVLPLSWDIETKNETISFFVSPEDSSTLKYQISKQEAALNA